jgi:outer membrane receptor protein involved in Fe transport
MSFYDVTSLEVLRGPQGTLYGRNATAGALNIHTTLPEEQVSGYARATTAETKRMAQNLSLDFSNLMPLQQPYLDFDDYRDLPLGRYRSVSYHSLTPKFGIEYQATPAVLVYVTYAKGFKSGGFELSSDSAPFQPEKLTDYEGGIKARLFDGKATLNLAGFVYNYDDLQVKHRS